MAIADGIIASLLMLIPISILATYKLSRTEIEDIQKDLRANRQPAVITLTQGGIADVDALCAFDTDQILFFQHVEPETLAEFASIDLDVFDNHPFHLAIRYRTVHD